MVFQMGSRRPGSGPKTLIPTGILPWRRIVNMPTIQINQLGYRPKDRKVACLALPAGTAAEPVAFDVIRLQGPPGKNAYPVVLESISSAFRADPSTGMQVASLDLTAVEDLGIFRIRTLAGHVSAPFSIGPKVYDAARDGMLKALYFMRCGCALEERHAGQWKHDVCHTGEALLHSQALEEWNRTKRKDDKDVRLDVSGGWHDAGDYGRYVGPGANAVADLLLAFQCFPRAFENPLNIPESGNGLPDLLNECRYEIEFLMKMQDRDSGGLFHKVATLQFPGYIMPEEDREPLYINHISSTATGDFAACLAAASVVYRPYDTAFSDRMLAAAEQAYAWLEANPDAPDFRNPPDVGSGEYGDRKSDQDERYWAAVELYRATGGGKYREAAETLARRPDLDRLSLGWADVGGLGTLSYLMLPAERQNPEVKAILEKIFFEEADRLASVCETDGFGISLKPDGYIWGSNMIVMNNAMHLILADQLRPNLRYSEAAAQHMHYLFGCNALGQSFVTGFGARMLLNPHYRPSVADGSDYPVPGLVSGGPCMWRADPATKTGLPQDTAPALVFLDDFESYSSNEVTIYWNAPAVFVAAYVTLNEG